MSNKYRSSAKCIPVEQAAGMVLAHDMTEIRPGEFKGPAFKKGQIISEEDIPHLRRIGKEHLYVLELEPGEVHEDDAAIRLCQALAGPGIQFDPNPSEGKISLKAAHSGLLKVDVQALLELNCVPDICCSSRHNHAVLEAGDIVASIRAIPLIIDESLLNQAVAVAEKASGLFRVKPLARPRTGVLITGNEVYSGLIEDKFGPIIKKKLDWYGCSMDAPVFSPDETTRLVEELHHILAGGVELLIVAGGMSVDPDDITRVAIARAGAEDVVYGTPVLPGAMFLYGRFGQVPVLGLPACVLFYKATVFDLILPRVLAGERITRRDIAALAHGGLCLNCERCRFPVCPFGKS